MIYEKVKMTEQFGLLAKLLVYIVKFFMKKKSKVASRFLKERFRSHQ